MNPDVRPRERVSRVMRERVFLRSGGTCERPDCDAPITIDTFHVSHLRAHASGGVVTEENLEAWCSRCNLANGPRDVRDTRVEPREWQLEALDTVVSRIIAEGAATVSAAPGAGKTIFAGLVYESLWEQGIVDRMVWLAPRRALVDQCVKALYGARHLQLRPHAEVERRGQDGVVVTYQSLTADTLGTHRQMADRSPTLLVLDEVHHVGEPMAGLRPAWPRNVAELAGTVDQELHVAGVLNLSGTLWRSRAGERISTVRYLPLPDGRLQSMVDFEVGAERLIRQKELRPIDLYRLDARVRVSDWGRLELAESSLADLDESPARAAVAAASKDPTWRAAFVRAVLERLEQAHRSLEGYHVKGLIVSARQDDARAFKEEIDEQMRARGLEPLAVVATSDEPDATKVLEDFRRQNRVGVLCTVDMAGEGYDCPDVVVVGYATNKLTTLYVRQVVARAMRVTDRERELFGRPTPAVIVLPDVPVLVEKMVSLLAPYTHELNPSETSVDEGEPGSGKGGELVLMPRYGVDEFDPAAETVSVAHTDGEVYDFEGDLVAAYARELETSGVPGVFAARAMMTNRRVEDLFRRTHAFESPGADVVALKSVAPQADQGAKQPTPISIEERALRAQRALAVMGRWWAAKGDTSIPIGQFQGMVNEAAGLPVRGGRERATPEQLERAAYFAKALILDWCERSGQPVPRLMGGAR